MTEPINYRELLKKYMQVVGTAESCFYLSYIQEANEGGANISPEEERELELIAKEVGNG